MAVPSNKLRRAVAAPLYAITFTNNTTGWAAVTGTVNYSESFSTYYPRHGQYWLACSRSDTGAASFLYTMASAIDASVGVYLDVSIFLTANDKWKYIGIQLVDSAGQTLTYTPTYLTAADAYQYGLSAYWSRARIPIPDPDYLDPTDATNAPTNHWVDSGTFDWTDIVKVGLVSADGASDGGNPCYIGRIAFHASPAKARLVFTCDDSLDAGVLALMNAHGYPCGFSLIGDVMNAGAWTAARAARDQGHVMLNHTYDHDVQWSAYADNAAGDLTRIALVTKMQTLMEANGVPEGSRIYVPVGGLIYTGVAGRGTARSLVHRVSDCCFGVTYEDKESYGEGGGQYFASTQGPSAGPHEPHQFYGRNWLMDDLGSADPVTLWQGRLNYLAHCKGFAVSLIHTLADAGAYLTAAEGEAVMDHVDSLVAAGLLEVVSPLDLVYGPDVGTWPIMCEE